MRVTTARRRPSRSQHSARERVFGAAGVAAISLAIALGSGPVDSAPPAPHGQSAAPAAFARIDPDRAPLAPYGRFAQVSSSAVRPALEAAGIDQIRPRNDDLESAIVLRPAPFTDLQDTRGASRELRETTASCDDAGAFDRGVWYVHTPAADGLLALTTTGSAIDTVLSAWRAPAGGAAEHPLDEIACNDDAFGESTSALVLRLRAGEPVYVKLAGHAGATGLVQLHAVASPRPPTHDDRAQAKTVDSLPFQESVWTATATDEADEVVSACAPADPAGPERGVWYRIDLATAGAFVRAGAGRPAVISMWSMEGDTLVERECAAGWLALDGEIGERVYVKIADPGDATPTTVRFEPRPPAPGNDALSAAEGLSLLPVSRIVTLWTATDEAGEARASCAAVDGEENGVWYRFTAPVDGRVIADGVGPDIPGIAANAAVISAWRGEGGHPLEELGCARADGAGGAPDHVALDLAPGEVVYFKLGAASSVVDSVPFNLLVAPPHDDLSRATLITALPYGDTLMPRYASLEPGEVRPSCAGFGTGTGTGTGTDFGSDSGRMSGSGSGSESDSDSGRVSDSDSDSDSDAGADGPRSMWYRFETGFGSRVAISSTLATGQAALSLWTVDSGAPHVHPLVEIACVAAVEGDAPILIAELPATGPVWLQVSTERRDSAAGTLTVFDPGPVPANDARADAALVAALPFTTTLITFAAGDDADEPRPSCDTGGGVERGVWYALTPPPGVPLTVGAYGSTYPVVLSAWEAPPGEPPREIGCARLADRSAGAPGDAEAGARWPALRLAPDPAGAPERPILIKAAGVGGAAGILSLTIAETPANDDLAWAVGVDSIPFTDRRAIHGATQEPAELSAACGEHPRAARGVWYRLVAPIDGEIEITTTGSDFDTVLSMWRGDRHPLEFIECNDDDGFSVQSRIAWRATAGESAWVKVGGFAGAVGELTLTVAPPRPPAPPSANDHFAAAFDASRPGYTSRVDARHASSEAGERTSACVDAEDGVDRSVWYRVTAVHDELIIFDTAGSDFDTVLSAWRGSAHPLTEIDCNDDDPETGALSSRLYVELVAGETIHLKVSPLDGDSAGTVVFSRDGYRILLPLLARNAGPSAGR